LGLLSLDFIVFDSAQRPRKQPRLILILGRGRFALMLGEDELIRITRPLNGSGARLMLHILKLRMQPSLTLMRRSESLCVANRLSP